MVKLLYKNGETTYMRRLISFSYLDISHKLQMLGLTWLLSFWHVSL